MEMENLWKSFFFAEKKRIGAYVDRVDIFLIDL